MFVESAGTKVKTASGKTDEFTWEFQFIRRIDGKYKRFEIEVKIEAKGETRQATHRAQGQTKYFWYTPGEGRVGGFLTTTEKKAVEADGTAAEWEIVEIKWKKFTVK